MRKYRNFFKKLDTVGDGSGIKIANGNYSSAGESFLFIPGDSISYIELDRLYIYIEDANGATADDYGNIPGGLTNGVEARIIEKDGYIQDLTNGVPIKTNGQWAKEAHDVTLIDWGAGSDSVTVRWDFVNIGKPIVMYPGEIFMIYLQDDLTGLTDHTFEIRGVEHY